MAWSGGKDSAMALWKLQQDQALEVVALLTTGNLETQRISMHGVRLELARAQAKAIGLPLIEVLVSNDSYNEYEQRMSAALQDAVSQLGISGVAFGDIFLEDLRKYREEKMRTVGLDTYFPLWKSDTGMLVQEFMAAGFETILCCVSDGHLTEAFAGRIISTALIAELPEEVDPCGENGEYHSFCFNGPIFSHPVKYRTGEKVYKPLEEKYYSESNPVRGFWYADLLE